MLTLTRLQAQRIRSVFRQAFGLRRKPRSRPIVLAGTGDQLQVRCDMDVLAASVAFAGEYSTETIAVPWDLLRECEGRRDDPVVVERISDGRISASFQDHGIPVVKWYDPIPAPSLIDDFPASRARCRDNPSELLKALQHAVEVANNSSARYALDHLRLRGSEGSIAATDGRQLLVQTGFEFYWEEDVLLPPMYAFGHRELQGHNTISIGKQGDWVTLLIGPWAFGLKHNNEGRFPKIEDNLRQPETALASLTIAEPDAKFLVDILPRLPSPDPSHAITLELNGSIALRTRPAGTGIPTEVVLRQSNWTGSDVRINSDRRFLANALRFGMRELNIFQPDMPLLCRDLRRSYVWMPLAADQALPPRAECVRIESPKDPQQAATLPTISNRIRASMPPADISTSISHENHPNSRALATRSQATQTVEEQPGVLELAKHLRDTLQAAAQQAGALVRGLKKEQKRAKSLRSTLLSLKQLQAIDA